MGAEEHGAGPPILNAPRAVVWLAAGLCALHVGLILLPVQMRWEITLLGALVPVRYGGASAVAALLPGGWPAAVWTPFTYMFLHGGWAHLILNLVWLLAFGSAVARRLETRRFVLFYLWCGFAGALAFVAFNPGGTIPVIGASGAISGLVGGAARFVFRVDGPLGAFPGGFGGPLSPPGAPAARSSLRDVLSDSRALTFILVWMGINVLFALTSVADDLAGGSIAWEAHLGGFLAGLLTFPMFDPPRRSPSGGPGNVAYGNWRAPEG